MCRILIHKYIWQDCGHSFLYRDSCRYDNNMICPLESCDTYLETFEEKCELCWERDKYLLEEREKAERRQELANIERQLQLEMDIERKRESIAKLRGEPVEQEILDEQKEDPGMVVEELQALQEGAKKDLEDVEMEDAPLDQEEIRSALEDCTEISPQYPQRNLELSPNSSASPPARQSPE